MSERSILLGYARQFVSIQFTGTPDPDLCARSDDVYLLNLYPSKDMERAGISSFKEEEGK